MSEVLNIDSVIQALGNGDNPFKSITVLEQVDSTNEWCLQQCLAEREVPFACLTDKQSRGRGRQGRRWISAPGASIAFSFVWSFDLALNQLGMLSLAIGMAVTNVLREKNISDAMLKWPNDVIVKDKKIAGILIETTSVNRQLNVIVGVGLNYSLMSDKTISSQDYSLWTDVCQCLGDEPPGGRDKLSGELLNACVEACDRYLHDKSGLSAEYDSKYNAFIHLPITVNLGDGKIIEGRSMGTTDNGELRVLVDGEEQVFTSGQVSLRKAY